MNLEWNLQQCDIKNVFLHGDLDEEIYKKIPPRYENTRNLNKVCKLKMHYMV